MIFVLQLDFQLHFVHFLLFLDFYWFNLEIARLTPEKYFFSKQFDYWFMERINGLVGCCCFKGFMDKLKKIVENAFKSATKTFSPEFVGKSTEYKVSGKIPPLLLLEWVSTIKYLKTTKNYKNTFLFKEKSENFTWKLEWNFTYFRFNMEKIQTKLKKTLKLWISSIFKSQKRNH